MKFISIVVIGYNGERFLKKCLDSIFCQTYEKYEVIYVDNASSDNSLYIAQKYPIKIVKLEKNIGFAGGCNTALSYCKGKFIFFINQDTIASQNLLSELMDNIKDNKVAIVYPHICDYKEYPRIGTYRCPLHFIPSIGALMYGVPSFKPIDVNFATGTAFIIRKEILQDLEYLFDHRLFMYYEDVDLSIRLVTKGYIIKWVPTAYVWHRYENPSLQAAFLSMRNIHLIIYKNFGIIYYIRTLPWILFQHTFIIGHFRKRHGIPIKTMLKVFFRAYLRMFLMIKSFRPVSSVKDTIKMYTKITPNKPAKEIMRDFQRKIILYG